MKVLLVIHGYPPRYNAGSEVYTQTLANGLHKAGVEVAIFCREEDPFLPDYHLRLETDPLNDAIPVYLVNHARSNARFRNEHVEDVFREVLDEVQPDIVHFGHLSHLSTSMIQTVKQGGTQVVFTLHDYWLMCPRGQFLQWSLTKEEPWALCDGQEDRECARKCYNRFVTGLEDDKGMKYWTGWINDRMAHIRMMCDMVDLFLAPSRHLLERHMREFGLDPASVEYLDYGFDLERLKGRVREVEDQFVFGYIGRHHPSKGIHHLLEAFNQIDGSAALRIWGRKEGQLTSSLQHYVKLAAVNGQHIVDLALTQCEHADNTLFKPGANIQQTAAGNQKAGPRRGPEWLGEYDNQTIVEQVFNHCDCIVVPSIWDENSPLVIHEAQQARVPVITTDHGGMGEYVEDGVNGLTFRHRDPEDLRRAMQQAIDDPQRMSKLGSRGYLYSKDGQIPSIESHVKAILGHYNRLLEVAL